MAALLIKVGALMMKTLAKPLAVRFEGWVMGHPVARQHVIKAAQVRLRLIAGIVWHLACSNYLLPALVMLIVALLNLGAVVQLCACSQALELRVARLVHIG